MSNYPTLSAPLPSETVRHETEPSHKKCGMECGAADMKPTRPHPQKPSPPPKFGGLVEPGRYADGNGLYLVVDPSGAKRWALRTVIHGQRRDLGLGAFGFVGLAEARELANNYRRSARSGGDPAAERRKARMAVPTFKAAAETVHAEHKVSWRNSKHAASGLIHWWGMLSRSSARSGSTKLKRPTC